MSIRPSERDTRNVSRLDRVLRARQVHTKSPFETLPLEFKAIIVLTTSESPYDLCARVATWLRVQKIAESEEEIFYQYAVHQLEVPPYLKPAKPVKSVYSSKELLTHACNVINSKKDTLDSYYNNYSASGNLEAIRWIHKWHKLNVFEDPTQCINMICEAAENGHIDVIKWIRELRSVYMDLGSDLDLWYQELFGYFDLQSEGWIDLQRGMREATKNGHFDVVEYMLSDMEGTKKDANFVLNVSCGSGQWLIFDLAISYEAEVRFSMLIAAVNSRKLEYVKKTYEKIDNLGMLSDDFLGQDWNYRILERAKIFASEQNVNIDDIIEFLEGKI